MNDKSLENIKNIIRTKEEQISNSQVKVNSLENKNSKLEKQKKSITKGWKTHISRILFYIGYSIVILFLLGVYITPVINVINTLVAFQKTICIIALYVGVLGISALGAYVASKVEMLLRNKSKSRSLEISKQIEINEQEIKKEKILQESLKKEITQILDKLDTNKEEISLSPKCYDIKEDYINMSYQEKSDEMPYIRKKKKNN